MRKTMEAVLGQEHWLRGVPRRPQAQCYAEHEGREQRDAGNDYGETQDGWAGAMAAAYTDAQRSDEPREAYLLFWPCFFFYGSLGCGV